MPLLRRSRRLRRRENDDPDSAPTGWNGVEDHIFAQDEDMMNDIAEDIDTLFVFAGLFSAVVTTFVIQLYQSLQPDTSQVPAQMLSIIALRTPELTESERSFLEATRSTIPAIVPSEAAPSFVVINTLWFASLVLSLVAALLGILVKQWCREYLKWRSSAMPPRENVMLRQMRYEAWRQWNVPTIVTSIPALLESALGFFLLGLVVFVWTLHTILAAIVTVMVAVSLILVVFLTILPALSHACPYKSPTGWAVVRSVMALQRLLSFVLHEPIPTRPRQWRGRDLIALSSAARYLVGPSSMTQTLAARRHIQEVNLLLRALISLRISAGHPRLVSDIEESMRSLRGTVDTMSMPVVCSSAITAWDLLPARQPGLPGLASSEASLLASLEKVLLRRSTLSDGTSAYTFKFRPRDSSLEERSLLGPYVFLEDFKFRGLFEGVVLPASLLCRRLHVHDLSVLVDFVVQATSYPTGDTERNPNLDFMWHCTNHDSRVAAEQFAMTLSILRLMPTCQPTRWLRATSGAGDYSASALISGFVQPERGVLVETLRVAYGKLARNDSATRMGLTSMVLEVLALMGRVSLTHGSAPDVSVVLVPFHELNLTDNLADLAIQTYGDTSTSLALNENIMFVLAADAALRYLPTALPSMYHPRENNLRVEVHTLKQLFDLMARAAQTSVMGLGQDIDLPWIETLSVKFAAPLPGAEDHWPHTQWGSSDLQPYLARLMDALAKLAYSSRLSARSMNIFPTLQANYNRRMQ